MTTDEPATGGREMAVVRAVAVTSAVVMFVSIVVGFATADFGQDGEALLGLTWGVVTLVDLYVAFTFVWLWIAWREADAVRAGIWLVLVAGLGSLAIAGYVVRASFRATSVPELLQGSRSA